MSKALISPLLLWGYLQGTGWADATLLCQSEEVTNSCRCISAVLSTTSLEVPQEGQTLLLFKLLGKLLLVSLCFPPLLFAFLSFLKVSGLAFPGRASLQAHCNLQREAHI